MRDGLLGLSEGPVSPDGPVGGLPGPEHGAACMAWVFPRASRTSSTKGPCLVLGT